MEMITKMGLTGSNDTKIQQLGYADLLQKFGRYIEGVFKKWYRCLSPPPTHWQNQVEIVADQANNIAAVATSTWLKTRIQEASQQGNYVLFRFQEQKLWNKVQKEEEDTTISNQQDG